MKDVNLRGRAEELFSWGYKHRGGEKAAENWRTHSVATAQVAETIAARCGLDTERAYACGLLHDIGRCGTHPQADTGIYHAYAGYQLATQHDLPAVARVCLTHSFYPKEKVEIISYEDKDAEQFVKDYINKTTYDDYDKLIQLADYMAGATGITTVERRFCGVLRRHGLPDPRRELAALLELKHYFDQKVGQDIYILFLPEIEQTFHKKINYKEER